MSRTWLILDCNYLSYRAFHKLGGLSHGGMGTGVVYGFFRDVYTLMNQFATNNVVFCFDHGKPLRMKDYPEYKAKRKNKVMEPEQLEVYIDLKRQINLLRTEYLKYVGFKNVLFQKGYEADDLIAWVVQNRVPKKDAAVVVSADHDLFQLIRAKSPEVVVWNPTTKVSMTEDRFCEEYLVTPKDWPRVKAIAGCNSDNIVGIKGVGEKTACKYLLGQLDGKVLDKIKEFDATANFKLVKLPYPGCGPFTIVEGQAVVSAKWRKLTDKLGMVSLADKVPGFGLLF